MVIHDGSVRKRFAEGAVDGKITCEDCFKIAKEMGIPKDEIASTLTDMDIKIIKCQIGCFS